MPSKNISRTLSSVLIFFIVVSSLWYSEAALTNKHDKFDSIKSPFDLKVLANERMGARALGAHPGPGRQYRVTSKRNSLMSRRLLAQEGSCQNNETLCGTTCVDLSTSPEHCGACSNLCQASFICCSSVCVDASSDSANCGACGNICPTKCINSMCGY